MSSPLARVRRATRRRVAAETEWREAMRAARDEGESLRAIAEAAGVTHPHVLAVTRSTTTQGGQE